MIDIEVLEKLRLQDNSGGLQSLIPEFKLQNLHCRSRELMPSVFHTGAMAYTNILACTHTLQVYIFTK